MYNDNVSYRDRVKISDMTKKLPASVLAYFREQGAKGGRIGGRRSLETMTREQRVARAKRASQAAVAARRRKAKKKR
jgi:hypothetical protein